MPIKVFSPVVMDWIPTLLNILGRTWFNANPYGNKYKINGVGADQFHTGADYNNNLPVWNSDNRSPIYSSFAGKVVFQGIGGGTWGHILNIESVDEHGEIFITRYAHIASPFVKAGDVVFAGQTIALVGDGDGRYIGTEHLHYDIAYGTLLRPVNKPNHWPGADLWGVYANYADPMKFLLNPVVPRAVKMKVTAFPWLNRRKSPNGLILGTIKTGTVVEVRLIEINNFYPLTDGTGWLHKNYLEPVTSPTPEPIPDPAPVPPPPKPTYVTRYVNAIDGLYMRAGPGTSYTIKGGLTHRSAVQVNLVGERDGFLQMDNTYWVSKAYLSETVPSLPDPTPLPSDTKRRHKIGMHCCTDTRREAINPLVPYLAGVVINTNTWLANELAGKTTVTFRMVWDGIERYNVKMLDGKTVEEAKQIGRNFYRGVHYSSTSQLDKRIYVKLVNECGFHSLDWAFWIGAMEEANKDGRKLAIFGDSLGTPEVSQWRERIPALRFAAQYGHVVILNQYSRYELYDGNPDNRRESNFSVADDEGYTYYGGRHEQFYDASPLDCQPPLVIGEAGPSNSRWTHPLNFVLDDMERYSDKLNARPYGNKVLYFAYWTLGHWEQCSYDDYVPEILKLVQRKP